MTVENRLPFVWALDTLDALADAVGSDVLLQSIALTIAAEELGADGTNFLAYTNHQPK